MSDSQTQTNKQRLALAICDFLTTSVKNGTIKEDDAEGIEVAVQCIAEAFGFDHQAPESTASLSIKPHSLQMIFDVFINTQKKGGGPQADRGSVQSDEEKAKAEALKSAGNKLMAEKKYNEAIEKYTAALSICPNNAVYYANRAAAHSQSGDHSKAVEDARLAVEVDPDYSKAYSRMGHAYFCLGNFEEAVDAYQRGLRLDPGNQSMKQSLSAAQLKLDEASGSSPGTESSSSASPGFPGLGGAGGMDFASIMSNPNFMNMAAQMMNNPAVSQMLNNPAVAQMAQNFMSNPSQLSELMADPSRAAAALGNLGLNQPQDN